MSASTDDVSNETPVEGDERSETQAVELRSNFNILTGSKYFQSVGVGIQFQTDEQGKIVTIPRDELADLAKATTGIDNFNNWAKGDTAAALKELYGDEAVAEYAAQIGMNPVQLNKWISVSKAFGWPNKAAEMRHSDPHVSHAHHQKVQGMNKNEGELKQRMNLLQEASDAGESVGDFYERVKKFKMGLGPDDEIPEKETKEGEFGVFRSQFRAYDPTVDNPEQYLTAFTEQVKTRDFPEYLDPAKRVMREAQEARAALIEKIPESLRAQVLAKSEGLKLEAFTELVNAITAKTGNLKKREKMVAKIEDADVKKMLLEKAATDISDDEFKASVDLEKKKIKSLKDNRGKIEKELERVEDETKRAAFSEVVFTNKLDLVQTQELLKDVLTEQAIEKESARIRKQAEDKIAKRQQFIKEKAATPPVDNSSKKKSDTAALPLGKKGGNKKASTKKPAPSEVQA